MATWLAEGASAGTCARSGLTASAVGNWQARHDRSASSRADRASIRKSCQSRPGPPVPFRASNHLMFTSTTINALLTIITDISLSTIGRIRPISTQCHPLIAFSNQHCEVAETIGGVLPEMVSTVLPTSDCVRKPSLAAEGVPPRDSETGLPASISCKAHLIIKRGAPTRRPGYRDGAVKSNCQLTVSRCR